MKILIEILAALFGKLVEALLNKPIQETGKHNDIAAEKHKPENPDDIFKPSDW